jgi:hypothetical protein
MKTHNLDTYYMNTKNNTMMYLDWINIINVNKNNQFNKRKNDT